MRGISTVRKMQSTSAVMISLYAGRFIYESMEGQLKVRILHRGQPWFLLTKKSATLHTFFGRRIVVSSDRCASTIVHSPGESPSAFSSSPRNARIYPRNPNLQRYDAKRPNLREIATPTIMAFLDACNFDSSRRDRKLSHDPPRPTVYDSSCR